MAADKFSLLAGIASDWWWEMDADLRFTFVSERLQADLRPAGIVAGRQAPHRCAATDYDNPAWRAHLDDLANHRPYRDFETTVIDATGASRPVKISGTPRFAADGTFEGYIGVGHDLTELRRQRSRLPGSGQPGIDPRKHRPRRRPARPRAQDRGLQSPPGRMAPGRRPRRARHVLRAMSFAIWPSAASTERRTPRRRSPIAWNWSRSRKRFVGERQRADGRIVSVTFNPVARRRRGHDLLRRDRGARRARPRWRESEERFRYLFGNRRCRMGLCEETLRISSRSTMPPLAAYGYSREEFLRHQPFGHPAAGGRRAADAAGCTAGADRSSLPASGGTDTRTDGPRRRGLPSRHRFQRRAARLALIIDNTATQRRSARPSASSRRRRTSCTSPTATASSSG